MRAVIAALLVLALGQLPADAPVAAPDPATMSRFELQEEIDRLEDEKPGHKRRC